MSDRTDPTVVRIDDDDTDLHHLDELPAGFSEPDRLSDKPTGYSAYGGHVGKTETFVKGQRRS